MVKLLGFRITPFFLFILGLECLALLLSIYLGVLLYRGTPEVVINGSLGQINNTGVFFLILVSLLTPGYFSQVKIIKVKKSVNEFTIGIATAIMSMLIIMYSGYTGFGTKTLFIAALLSACIGLSAGKLSALGKYRRFPDQPGVN